MKNKSFSLMIAFLAAAVLFLGLLPVAHAEGGQVSGVAWVDKDYDGSNNGERGIQSVKVTLQKVNSDGTVQDIVSTRTAANGSYAIAINENGTYQLAFVLPEDYRFTRHGNGSDVLPASGNESTSLPFSIADGNAVTVNAGALSGRSYVSVIAFEDLNLNGGRRESEPLVKNVQIDLYYEYQGNAYLIADTHTNKDGEASISYLSPGTYYIKATLPDNFVAGPLGTKITSFYNCMNPSTDTVCYSIPFEVPNKGGVALGAGVVTTGSVSGRVWQDEDGNQTENSGDTPCTAAKVTIHSEELNITRSASLDAQGCFTLTGLQPTVYQLTYILPDGMIFADSADSVINDIASQGSMQVTVYAQVNTPVDAVGATAASQVSLAVYDAGEEEVHPLSQVQATLIQNGKEVCSAVSDENGLLLFPIARSGHASVSVALPQGYVVSPEPGVFPYANCLTSPSFDVEVPLRDVLSLEGFAVQSASISGTVVEDPTNTGIITETNLPLAGYTVQAIDCDNLIVQETVSDENGCYSLSNLVPGTYYVRFLLDDRYISAPYMAEEDSRNNSIYMQEPLFGETDAFVLYAGQQKISVNAALFKAGIVDGYVLLNPDYNQLATNHGGAANVKVTLLDEFGTPWQDYAYDITDENGYFCIKGILPGNYSLQYELHADCAFVVPDIQENIWNSNSFAIVNGSEIHVDDVGVVLTSVLSGKVIDYTTDAGVSASLSMTSERTGKTITVSTDENGLFAFDHLLPDGYRLDVTLNNDYLFADSPASVFPYSNSSTASADIAIPMGASESNCNIIASLPVDWQMQLYLDANGNNSCDPNEISASNRAVDLYLREDLIGTYTSDSNGMIRLENIIPASYTLQIALAENEILVAFPEVDTVTINQDMAQIAILPYADIQGQVWSLDQTNNGVSGLTVSLIQNGDVLATAATDDEGRYSFTNLLAGNYQLRIELKDGFLFARMQDVTQRNSYILSQIDGSLLYGNIPLQMGQSFTGVDIGIGSMGAIGDYAWLDLNKNGMQDIDDMPLPGIVIELYQYDALVACATTNEHGRYAIKNLYPGKYEMRVTMPKEVKPTLQQTEFPLVASILPESNDTTVIVEEVIVPSDSTNNNLDLGFVLKKKNVYPQSIQNIPTKDWSIYPHPEN